MWQETYQYFWTMYKNVLLVKGNYRGTDFYILPMGMQENLYSEIAGILREDAQGEICFEGILENEKSVLQNMFGVVNFFENRDNFDYVYLQSDLANFSGRKFHGQKNHLNAFYKAHPDAKFEIINQENAEECLSFAYDWCDERFSKDPNIIQEKLALEKCFANFTKLELRGGLLRFDGKVQAFSIGDKFNDDTADIHFEKAKSGVRGLYVAMCNAFAKNMWQDVIYLNREEDMGLDGLRKAKTELHPAMLIKKYTAVVK